MKEFTKHKKSWELFVGHMGYENDSCVDISKSDFRLLFGYLLEFFSTHGIEIERSVTRNRYNKFIVRYNVYYGNGEIHGMAPIHIQEEAVAKAFEILEGRLK